MTHGADGRDKLKFSLLAVVSLSFTLQDVVARQVAASRRGAQQLFLGASQTQLFGNVAFDESTGVWLLSETTAPPPPSPPPPSFRGSRQPVSPTTVTAGLIASGFTAGLLIMALALWVKSYANFDFNWKDLLPGRLSASSARRQGSVQPAPVEALAPVLPSAVPPVEGPVMPPAEATVEAPADATVEAPAEAMAVPPLEREQEREASGQANGADVEMALLATQPRASSNLPIVGGGVSAASAAASLSAPSPVAQEVTGAGAGGTRPPSSQRVSTAWERA